MKTIAIANAAGSAGKTTTAVTLAALIAETGRSVLLVDADAQATATTWLGVAEPAAGVGDVLLKDADLCDVLVAVTSAPRVSLVPATSMLDGQAQRLASVHGAEMRMARMLRDADADVCLIDCPGAVSVITAAAIVAADNVATVTMPTMKEIRGIPRMLQVVADIADAYGAPISLDCIIPCRVPPRTAGGHYLDAMALLDDDAWSARVAPPVRQSVRVPESLAYGRPLPVVYPHEHVTGDYRAVLEWLHARGVLP